MLRAAFLITLLLPSLALAQQPTALSLKSGDRVVFLGGGWMEQEQFHGYLETRLTALFPDADVVFRNLAWSGDTVRGTARTSGYQNPDGFARLLREVELYRPTHIFLAYGNNESFAGEAGLKGFLDGYWELLAKLTPLKTQVIILSPICHENLGPPFPDPTEHNRQIEAYSQALKKLAEADKLAFIDLFDATMAASRNSKGWTTNGVQPNARGYEMLASTIVRKLAGVQSKDFVVIYASGKVVGSGPHQVSHLKVTPTAVKWQCKSPVGYRVSFQMKGFEEGKFTARRDGKLVDLEPSGIIDHGPPFSIENNEDALRKEIVAKNELHYRRWRPFNDHQRHWGFIGGDGKLYDDLIAASEKRIAELRQPIVSQYELLKVEGK